jgi:hypothetical protein
MDLLEAKLDLILTISNNKIGDNVFIGSARIDIEGLIFAFFNGQDMDSKTEKKIVSVKQGEENIVGVIEIAIGVSSVLEDDEKCIW